MVSLATTSIGMILKCMSDFDLLKRGSVCFT